MTFEIHLNIVISFVKVKIKYAFPWMKFIGGSAAVIFLLAIAYFTKDSLSLKMASLQNISGLLILVSASRLPKLQFVSPSSVY